MSTQDSAEKSWLARNMASVLLCGAFGLFFLIAIVGGSGGDFTPMEKVRIQMRGTPTYSVVLEDAKEEGNFFKDYYQKLQVIVPGDETVETKITSTDWLQTNGDDFEALLPFLGMTVLAKKDGKETTEASPPGYEYVGDERYGRWNNSGTGLLWLWYGHYAFWGSRYGTGSIARSDYDTYASRRSGGEPYFGPNNQYGTQGAYTKSKHPSFYERHNSRQLESRATFSRKVQSRIGRNSVAVRSRSGGVGK